MSYGALEKLQPHIRHASILHRIHSLEEEPQDRQALPAKGDGNTEGVIQMYFVGMLERASEMLYANSHTR